MKLSIRRGLLAAATLALGTAAVAAAPVAASASAAHPHASTAVNKPVLHVHRATTGHGARVNSTSTNWAGYAAYGTTFNSVSGTWVVPAVNCSWGATGASSTWVGLDGYGNGTVEQLGTAQTCFWGGASYHAWYELYPQAEIALPSGYAVYPGDVIHAWTSYSNTADSYWFHMQNRTRGWTWNLTVHAPAPPNHPTNATAEWITEQPSCFYTCSWLANYGRVTFTEAVASRPSSPSQFITSFPNDPITQTDGGSVVKARPSAITNYWNGSSFSVQFLHS